MKTGTTLITIILPPSTSARRRSASFFFWNAIPLAFQMGSGHIWSGDRAEGLSGAHSAGSLSFRAVPLNFSWPGWAALRSFAMRFL